MAGLDTLPAVRLSKQEGSVSNPEASKPATAKGMAASWWAIRASVTLTGRKASSSIEATISACWPRIAPSSEVAYLLWNGRLAHGSKSSRR